MGTTEQLLIIIENQVMILKMLAARVGVDSITEIVDKQVAKNLEMIDLIKTNKKNGV